MWRVIGGAACVVAVTGCASSRDVELSASEVRAAYAEAFCARRRACAEDFGFPYDDLAACEALAAHEVAAGSTALEAEGCAQALAAQSCEDMVLGERLPECEQVSKHQRIEIGEPCDGNVLCEEGAYCDHSAGECGVCVAQGAVGDVCRLYFHCETLRCEAGRCAPPGEPGAACGDSLECEGHCREGRCEAGGPLGGSCVLDDECDSGRCEAGECVPFAAPRLGDPCEDWCLVRYENAWWGARLECVDGTCVEAAGEGEACSFFCREGYGCIEGRCRALPAPGQGEVGDWCELPAECAPGLTCTGRFCAALGAPGDDCLGAHIVNGGCEPGAFCDTSGGWVCARRKADGEPCDRHEHCLSGSCSDDDICVPSVCGR